MSAVSFQFDCPMCGQPHAPVELRRGEKASCVRCGTLLARRSFSGVHAPLAWSITGLILAIPSCWIPFVILSRFGNVRISYLDSGVRGLFHREMPVLAVWVLFCGMIAPLCELVFLALILSLQSRISDELRDRWVKAAHRIQHWSMPEIHILAVLVAFFKIGALAQTNVGPGFFCYAAGAFATLFAWRTFTLEPHRVIAEQEHAKP